MLHTKVIISLILVSLLVVGCGSKMSRGEFLDMKYEGIKVGKQICNNNKMEYLANDIKDFDEQYAICITQSPFKLYTYEVEI